MRYLFVLTTLFIGLISMAQNVVINEVDSDTPSTDTKEFIELKTASPNMSLDTYVLVLFNGGGEVSYKAYDLDGYSSDQNGLFVLGSSTLSPVPDYTVSNGFLQNGPDAVAIYQDNASTFPAGTAPTTTNLVDAFVYGTNDADDVELLNALGEATQYDEDAAGDKDNHSLQRLANGTYEAKESTPGALNEGGGSLLPTLTISSDKLTYSEGEVVNLIFTVSENVSSDLVLNYTLVNDNFLVNDYNGALSVTIVAGTSSNSTSLVLVDDDLVEGTEYMNVSVTNLDASSYQAANNNYEIKIWDNDYDQGTWGTPVNPTFGLVNSTAVDGYYSSLNGKSGAALKAAITDIVANPSIVHAQTYGDVWEILKEADVNPENEDEIWLLYSEIGRAKTDQQSSGSPIGKWNREHVYPQSRGGFKDGTSTSADGKDIYMSTDASNIGHGHSDAHALRPADSSVNSSRSNKDYGQEYDGPSGNVGSWHGDVARSLMYMACRYDGLAVVSGNPENTTVGEMGDLTYLLTWHVNDKPDDYEMNRNNVIYDWQKNRNPFIDLPELVDYVFGSKVGEVWNGSTGVESVTSSLSFYPNPVISDIVFDELIEGKLLVLSLSGNVVLTEMISGNTVDLSALDQGIYLYQIISDTKQYNGKFLKK